MGSFMTDSYFFYYNGMLYTFEEWDRDYAGTVYYISPAVDDFVTDLLDKRWLDVPLLIPLSVGNKDKNLPLILESLHAADTLFDFVLSLAKRNVFVRPHTSLLPDIMREKDLVPTTRLSFDELSVFSEWRKQRVAFFKAAFGISNSTDDHEFLILHDDTEYRVKVLCPEYALLLRTSDDSPVLWDLRGVEEATIHLSGACKLLPSMQCFKTSSRYIESSLRYRRPSKLLIVSY